MPTKLSRYCEGIMEAAWIAAVILVPVFFNIYSARIFEPDKITLLRSLALIILAAWMIKLIDEGQIRWERIEPGKSLLQFLKETPLLLPVVGLALVYLVSTLLSVSPRVSLWGSYQRMQGLYSTLSYIVIFAAIAANLRKRAQVERLVTSVVITSLPVSLYGVLQRYRIDPVPWGGNVSTRIASNMGNSIFVAAYLIMAFPLTIGRVVDSFQAILKDNQNLPVQVARGTVYVFTAALQVIALYMSGSRGPAMGWLASVYILALLIVLRWQKRNLAKVMVGLSVAMVLFLAVFNLPNGPLESLRNYPAIGRFGHLLDAESKTALVRKYIWEGAVDMVLPHEPLEFPSGERDRLNFLRTLIGYGPESMYVAYNPFYPPELGHVERRNATPDRSHNESWDSLVITGVLGLVVYLSVFLSVIYFGLKWLGLIQDNRQRSLFLGLSLAGGAIGALAVSALIGLEYIGVGIPFGILGGLWIYLAWRAFAATGHPEALSPGESDRSLMLAVLLAAILGHFVEINFGIAIAATRTHFWTFAALLFVVGYVLPRHGEYQTAGSEPQVEPAPVAAREMQKPAGRGSMRARKRRSERNAGFNFEGKEWLRLGAVSGLIVALLMMTIGYDFITNPNHLESGLQILWRSLTTLPNRGNAVSFGVLAMVFTTWLAAAVVVTAEALRRRAGESFSKVFGVTMGVSGVIVLLFWLMHAGRLASISRYEVNNVDRLLNQVGMVEGLLSSYYIYLFLVIFLMARFLPVEWPARTTSGSVLSPLSLAVAVPLIGTLIYTTNLRVIYADIVFKMAESFNEPSQLPIGTTLYQRANQLASNEDHYYLFLGRNYLEQAKAATTEADQEAMVREAEADLKIAQGINPLNTDHTANLARLYSWWASVAQSEPIQKERGEIASDYYARALTLSPQNSTLWGEWAILFMQILKQPDQAYERLVHALELDDRYNWTQALMADYYMRAGQSSAGEAEKTNAYEKAIAHYRRAIEVSAAADTQSKINYLSAIAGVYTEMAKVDEAIQAYEEALALGPRLQDLWRLEEAVARLYATAGNKTQALLHANNALTNAPEEQVSRLQEVVLQIEQLP